MAVPAHVTVLHPFVPPAQVDEHVISALRAALGSVAAFECSFARIGWFGEDVLWLDPEPATPFQHLTAAVMAAIPDPSPYGGAHEVVVPHLTVGDSKRGSVSELQAAERDVRRGLPVRARIDRAVLMAGAEAADSWSEVHGFPLGAV